MIVTVRLFAILRERAGRDSIEVELADRATVADALAALGEQQGLGELLERMPVRMAVNRDYATDDMTLEPGDELALVPPVSGGATTAGDLHVRVTEEPLSLEALSGLVSRSAAGAIVCFQGTVRDVDHLEYEAYREMAEERMAEILRSCIERHGLQAAAAEHRIGSVPLGEAGVIVAVSAGHRGEAFAGARVAIDRIKAEAPIWKREVEGGEEAGNGSARRRWVEGTQPPVDRPAGRAGEGAAEAR